MKKLLSLFIILISLNSFSQNIDTIYVRYLTLRTEDWYWLKGNWSPSDESSKAAWKKMRTKLNADNPASNTTLVMIDSIPGKVALAFYNTFMQFSKGETSSLTNTISQNIKAYTPMLPFTNAVDADMLNRFQNNRKNGKDDFDN